MHGDAHSTATTVRQPEAFEISVPQSVLDDLHHRLERTRWINELGEDGWDFGLSIPYMRELVRYWHHEFDWRVQEAAINRFSHHLATIDDHRIHFIHERGNGPDPLPIILTHGFPDSFLRFAKVIPLLADPASHGGNASDAFDVIVPSLPGYAYSTRDESGPTLFQVADLWHRLLTEQLGYDRFAAHGGDWGSFITEMLARDHSSAVVGIHLTDVPYYHAIQPPKDPSRAEEKYLKSIEDFASAKGAYAMIQSAQPHVLALGLNDSPAALAGWLIEKFRSWSDCDGDVESSFSNDELLSNVMIYWVTGTINQSFGPYADIGKAGALEWTKQKLKQVIGSSDVPAGFAMFPKDLSSPPREWAERFFDVRRWTEMPRGGHFAALEEPELLVNDIREFFRPLRRV
jgi:pimeloyl-ACP methyl ester carboxylesterase